jgi:DNA-binding response OmpR family regulator
MKRILIIEDEEEYSDMLRLRLEAHGFTVMTATDGAGGLAKARKSLPDLIILDVMLPGADGGEVAQMLMSDPVLSAIPVVFLTAAITADESRRRWAQSSERILAKTMDGGTIVQKIHQVLAERRSSRESASASNKAHRSDA